MNALSSIAAIEPTSPLEIEPRPCELCGLTIDQHRMVDDGDGPEFFCHELPANDLVRQWEMRDPRDRWRHTGEVPPPETVRNSDIGTKTATARLPYRTPQSTIDEFLYVVGLKDPPRLAAWLRAHPRDSAMLLKLVAGK